MLAIIELNQGGGYLGVFCTILSTFLYFEYFHNEK